MSAARERKADKKHDCTAQINKLLEPDGDCLQRFIRLKSSKVELIALATERKDGERWKRGSTWLMATFCPFCGVKLANDEDGTPKAKEGRRRHERERSG